MSLINDALKRAGQVKPPPPPDLLTQPQLHPVEYRNPSALPLFLVPALLVLVLAAATWFFVKGWQAQRSAERANKMAVLAREVTPGDSQQTRVRPGEALSKSGDKGSSGAALAAGKPGVEPTSSTNDQLTVAEPAKPTFPAVRLQGIFYRTAKPSVMINAKTVFIGDKVASAKVMAITRESVTLEWNGETRVLTLE